MHMYVDKNGVVRPNGSAVLVQERGEPQDHGGRWLVFTCLACHKTFEVRAGEDSEHQCAGG